MTKFSVKKPYLTIVWVIIILVLGGVSLTKMQTDLLPDISMPYLMVITTEPGASPEKVETEVSKPLEGALGTISGVKTIVSNSAENYSIVMLEFNSGTNMDSAMVKVSAAINMVSLPEVCGTPNILEISMDMMATMYATVSYDDKDITEISEFTEEVVIPYIERKEGVANITEVGHVTQTMEVRLNEDKIDKINDDILVYTNDKLSDAEKKLDKAQKKLDNAEKDIKKGESELTDNQNKTNDELSAALSALDGAKATKAAYEATLSSYNASKSALSGELKAYEDNKIKDTYKTLDDTFKSFAKTLETVASASGIEIPAGIEDAAKNPDKLNAFIKWMGSIGYGEQVGALTYDSVKSVYDIVNVRIPQIDTELANLDIKIKTQEAIIDKLNSKMKDLDDNYQKALSGALSASAGFGSANAQLESGKTGIDDAKKELKDARKDFKDSKKAAKENANLDALLSLDALSGLIYAQNFAMPAGYIDDKNDEQWLLKVGEEYESVSDIENMVLCKAPGVGAVRLSDVCDVTVMDDSDNKYARYNGKAAVLLSIYKASTANTSEVSKNCREAITELENKYPGLHMVPFVDQANYISMFLDSVLYSILIGAILAIIVLALFLKSVKPTIVVAFSIPFSVLFAIIIMYFTGININVMSLAGIGLAIGMLVDNSIVVIENIFRLRSKGVAPARAAVQGAKQVSSAIIASTLTTICVFLPMVFTSGLVRDLVIPFAFTITYALTASLLVALTIVPTMGSVFLKRVKVKKQPLFEKVINAYGKVLAWCLRFKIVSIAVALGLLIFCVVMVFKMGIVMIPQMNGNEINVSAKMPEDMEKADRVAVADDIINKIMEVDGVAHVGAMDNMGATNMLIGGMAQDAEAGFEQFAFYVIPDESYNTVGEIEQITEDIKNVTKDIKCEISVGAEQSMSEFMASGLSVNVIGDNLDDLMSVSKDVMDIMEKVPGLTEISDGMEESKDALLLVIDKDKAAKKNLTVAQIYSEITERMKTDKEAAQVTIDNRTMQIKLIDETDMLTYENLMELTLEVKKPNDKGEEKTKEYKLSEFAKIEKVPSAAIIVRQNQARQMTVSSKMEAGANATLAARELEPLLKEYTPPEGVSVEIAGESEEVEEMLEQMLLAIVLGLLLIYLVMVAQFQSLLSPFIVLFTIPLAFTGGFIGLLIFGEQLSSMSLMGFMVLMGTVVNNGIVFVDYTNQLRIQGLDKKTALIAAGKTRLRPILMTAITTVLAMSNMVFTKDAGSVMAKGMAIVISGGLLYSTIMTLLIVPVMYDIFYRKTPKVIDVGEDLDDEMDDAKEYMLSLKE